MEGKAQTASFDLARLTPSLPECVEQGGIQLRVKRLVM